VPVTLVKVGRLTRFHRNIVIVRVQAGLFGSGIEVTPPLQRPNVSFAQFRLKSSE